MPNNVRNRDGDIYTPYGWELHNCSEITEEKGRPSACDGAVIYPERDCRDIPYLLLDDYVARL